MSSRKHTIGVIGSSECGKSTFLHKLLNPPYARRGPTIGFDILTLDERNLFYDFSGRPAFRFLIDKYVNTCDSFLLCYDISSAASLTYLDELVASKIEMVKPTILVGLKKDLLCDITEKRLGHFMEKYHLDYHCRVSALGSTGLEGFTTVLDQVCKFSPPPVNNLDQKANKMSPLLLGAPAYGRRPGRKRTSYCDQLRAFWASSSR